MPPVLDPKNSKVDGLAFIGLSLARKSEDGHPESYTHQESFDFNLLQDRAYDYISATNDDGWLVGGGEPGPPKSYKLKAKDSGHVEIIRLGTYNPEWGGVSLPDVLELMTSGKILIPQIEVLPTAVMANPDSPPELEIRFDMDPPYAPDVKDDALPVNWQLRFLHNQLFKQLIYPSRFCPGPFHSTILRKADFRSPKHEQAYFEEHCGPVLEEWKIEGPKPLNTVKRTLTGEVVAGDEGKSESESEATEKVDEAKAEEISEEATANEEPSSSDTPPPDSCHSGVWLFTDRENISHFFQPNFLPPYNTPEKRKIICDILAETWDEPTLSWKPTPKKPTPSMISNLMNKASTSSKSLSAVDPFHANPNTKKKKKELPPLPAEPILEQENVSIQLLPSGKFLSVSTNGKLVLMGHWNKARCTFSTYKYYYYNKEEEKQEAIGVQFAANKKWMGLNMLGNVVCVAKTFSKREAWSVENDLLATPFMNSAAGWGAGSYMYVESGTTSVKLVELKGRKKAALWSIKKVVEEEGKPKTNTFEWNEITE